MKTILVTGASGQLGKCIVSLKNKYRNFHFVFADSKALNITEFDEVATYFATRSIDWCINCAAYTAVDQAEDDVNLAEKTNVIGAKNLAIACTKHNAKIIHVSTDFVFDGTQGHPYVEVDKTNPESVYGRTKRDGELQVSKFNPNHFIIRTSWLYSEYNNNFMKTMLRLSQDRKEINVVSDQTGTPTYAKDLSMTILEIINIDSQVYGMYHYSNEGVASWYDFAKAIFELSGIDIKTVPINTVLYPTPAKRPFYSVLDKSKIKQTFNIDIPYWRDSLRIAISNLKAQ